MQTLNWEQISLFAFCIQLDIRAKAKSTTNTAARLQPATDHGQTGALIYGLSSSLLLVAPRCISRLSSTSVPTPRLRKSKEAHKKCIKGDDA